MSDGIETSVIESIRASQVRAAEEAASSRLSRDLLPFEHGAAPTQEAKQLSSEELLDIVRYANAMRAHVSASNQDTLALIQAYMDLQKEVVALKVRLAAR